MKYAEHPMTAERDAVAPRAGGRGLKCRVDSLALKNLKSPPAQGGVD